MASLHCHLMLTHVVNQVARNEELLNTVKDCFYFATRFFEPIKVSATHIYHSALELSPPSSIIRRLYYHRRHNPFPRVVHGWLESWDECTHLSCAFDIISHTWSPCGRFVALQTQEAVEIRDALSSERLSTLTSAYSIVGELAYSPDRSSLACLSHRLCDHTLAIWDIQTGGVTKEIRGVHLARSASLTWSLDGGSIGINFSLWNRNDTSNVVRVYGVASDEPSSPVGPFWSHSQPYLWAHDTSFRVMTTRLDNQVYTIEISEVGSVLTEIESFCIEPWGQWGPSDSISIESFSPTAYRISIVVGYNQILILDVRNLECLLEKTHYPALHSFSSDGSLFGISSDGSPLGIPTSTRVKIWKYTSSRYTPWRDLPIESSIIDVTPPLQFSPNLSSVLVPFSRNPQVWRLDGPPTVARPDSCTLSTVLSHCGTYIATWRQWGSTITITDLHSQTPHFIDTGMRIYAVAFTGNILLVLEEMHGITLVAWRLTEGGVVDGIFADRRAGRGDSIWTVMITASSMFSFEDQIVIIVEKGNLIHAYHIGTGEVLNPTRASPHSYDFQCSLWDVMDGRHYPCYCELPAWDMPSKDDWPVSETTLRDGWVKDPEGKHRLWILPEWRTIVSRWDMDKSCGGSSWLPNITTLRLECKNGTVIIMF